DKAKIADYVEGKKADEAGQAGDELEVAALAKKILAICTPPRSSGRTRAARCACAARTSRRSRRGGSLAQAQYPNLWRAPPDRLHRSSWLRMLRSVILSSAASIAAFDRMIDSKLSPSNGRRTSAPPADAGTMQRYRSSGSIRMLPEPRWIL